ncbi:hypothetical protein [Terrarubrum flagellatum]|uniref:hypothetical protein n=1 Tax=Terrirubrum flagellatum TaxID=2895980 RepID=UPI0031453382
MISISIPRLLQQQLARLEQWLSRLGAPDMRAGKFARAAVREQRRDDPTVYIPLL